MQGMRERTTAAFSNKKRDFHGILRRQRGKVKRAAGRCRPLIARQPRRENRLKTGDARLFASLCTRFAGGSDQFWEVNLLRLDRKRSDATRIFGNWSRPESGVAAGKGKRGMIIWGSGKFTLFVDISPLDDHPPPRRLSRRRCQLKRPQARLCRRRPPRDTRLVLVYVWAASCQPHSQSIAQRSTADAHHPSDPAQMASFPSASISGLSTPQTQRYAVRTEHTSPRSPRTGPSHQQHSRHTSSQSGSKVRAWDLDDEPCLSHKASRKCLKCQRDARRPTPEVKPIQSGRNIATSRLKVRTGGRDSGSACVGCNEAPHADSEGRLQTARSQVHQRPNQLFEAKHTNRRLASEKQAQVAALASPLAPEFPPTPASLPVPSTPPQHLRALRNRPHLATQGSVPSFTSLSASPLSRCFIPPSSGYSTPSPSTRSRKSRSIRYVSSSLLTSNPLGRSCTLLL